MRPASLAAEGVDDFRVAGVDRTAGAGQQPAAVPLADAERPHPIDFTFEDPAVANSRRSLSTASIGRTAYSSPAGASDRKSVV